MADLARAIRVDDLDDDDQPTSPAGWRGMLARLFGLPTMPAQGSRGEGFLARMWRRFGGQIHAPPQSQTRWLLSDLEDAVRRADMGDLRSAARLCRAMRRDGVLAGVLSTRTEGLVRLPIRWSGHEYRKAVFEGRDRKRGLFASMFPSPDVASLAADGILLGVGVGEMLPVAGTGVDGPRQYKFRRLDPEFLQYRWAEDAWYFLSLAGPILIEPGVQRADGGWWVLHRPGGESTPWQKGLWPSLGHAYIAKEHAKLHRDNYGAKLAQAARAATSPAGATETQRRNMLAQLIGWGVNQSFELPPGWDVKLIESNGKGYDVFQATIDTSNNEFIVSIAGQTVTTDGGSGFANSEIHKSTRADLIQSTGDALALTLNEQGILPYVNERWGAGALASAPWMEWDTSPPKELKAQAEALTQVALAVSSLNATLQPYDRRIDFDEIAVRFGVPLLGVEQPATQPREDGDGADDTGAVDPADLPALPGAQMAPPGPGKGNGEKTGFGETRALRLVGGRDALVAQTLIFDRDSHESVDEAFDWARARGYATTDASVTGAEIRLEQMSFDAFDASTLRAARLDDGVLAIVGRLAQAEAA